eukprot:87820-Pyramimonas_sp.AAC.2
MAPTRTVLTGAHRRAARCAVAARGGPRGRSDKHDEAKEWGRAAGARERKGRRGRTEQRLTHMTPERGRAQRSPYARTNPIVESENLRLPDPEGRGGTIAGVAEHPGPPCRRSGTLPKYEPLVQSSSRVAPTEGRTKSSANNAGSLSITMDGGAKRRASVGGTRWESVGSRAQD